MTIYQRIKDLASDKNISIRELESTLGLSNGTLSKWKNRANTEKMEKVANYFGVSIDYLLGKDSPDSSDGNSFTHIDIEDIVANASMLTSREHALSDEDRVAIKAMLTGYLNSKEGQHRLKEYGGYDKQNSGENGDD